MSGYSLIYLLASYLCLQNVLEVCSLSLKSFKHLQVFHVALLPLFKGKPKVRCTQNSAYRMMGSIVAAIGAAGET